jgi:hypothetical protein
LSELADYAKSTGTAMFLRATKKTAWYLGRNPKEYRLHLERKEIAYHPARIQALESLGFEWNGTSQPSGRPFEQACRLRKKARTPNIPKIYSETPSWASGSNPKVSIQVARRRKEIAHDPESRIGV